MQLMKNIFKSKQLSLFLLPYEITVTSSDSGIIGRLKLFYFLNLSLLKDFI